MKKKMLFREMYKTAMIIIAFIGIVIQADAAHPFERSEEKTDVINNGTTLSASQVSEIQNIFKIEPNGMEVRSEKSEVRKKDSEVRSEKVNTNYELRIANYEKDTAITNYQVSVTKRLWQW